MTRAMELWTTCRGVGLLLSLVLFICAAVVARADDDEERPTLFDYLIKRSRIAKEHSENLLHNRQRLLTNRDIIPRVDLKSIQKDARELGEEYFFGKYYNHEIGKLEDRQPTENRSVHDIMLTIKSDIKNAQDTIDRDVNESPEDSYLDSFYETQNTDAFPSKTRSTTVNDSQAVNTDTQTKPNVSKTVDNIVNLEQTKYNTSKTNANSLNDARTIPNSTENEILKTNSYSDEHRVETPPQDRSKFVPNRTLNQTNMTSIRESGSKGDSIVTFFKAESEKRPFVKTEGIFGPLDEEGDTYVGDTSEYNDSVLPKIDNANIIPLQSFIRQKSLQEIQPSSSLRDQDEESGDYRHYDTSDDSIVHIDSLLDTSKKIVAIPKNTSIGGRPGAGGMNFKSTINSSSLPATSRLKNEEEFKNELTSFIEKVLHGQAKMNDHLFNVQEMMRIHGPTASEMNQQETVQQEQESGKPDSPTDNDEKIVYNNEPALPAAVLEDDHEIRFYSVDNSTAASCMDGTPPGYYLRKGWNGGDSKWIIHLHGGAWCYDLTSCSKRRNTILGSTSSSVTENIDNFFHGILSKNPKINPRFYNWNVAVLSYCDGGLFSGNRRKSLIGKGKNFYFQGRKILKLLMEDLQRKSLTNATDVILSGTSAGGLAIILQGDYMRQFISPDTHVRGLIDAGIFLDQMSPLGNRIARRQFKALYSLHKPVLSKDCLMNFSRRNKFLCLFPENAIKNVKLPLFIVNALYDHWQLSELEGIHCVYDDKKCETKQHDHILNFRNQMYGTLAKVKDNKNDTGVFANSCLAHGQAIIDYTWSKVRINNESIEDAFSRWFDDLNLREHADDHFSADCKYPCNGSCPRVLAQRCVRNFKGASESRRRRDAELC